MLALPRPPAHTVDMSAVSMERLSEWLNPSEGELSALATSQEEFEYFCSNATAVRSRFVVDAAKQEAAERSATPHSGQPEDLFATLPVRDVLTRHWHNRLIPLQRHVGSACSIKPNQWYRYWAQLAERQAELEGFYPARTKYDDFYYTIDRSPWKARNLPAEPMFDAAVERSQLLVDHQYPVRFHMRGVRYIKTAALDMDTVRDWVLGRTTFDVDSLRESWRNGDQDFGKFSWGWAKDQVTYWQDFLPVYDRAYKPLVRKQDTYADAVKTLAPGVFKAEYIPEQITASGNFIDFDDMYRASITAGNTLSAATKSFGMLVQAAMRHEDSAVIETVKRHHLGSLATSQSGVIFMSRDAAVAAFEQLHAQGGARQSMDIVDACLVEQRSAEEGAVPDMSELDRRLVFGWDH
jgi:hypothetical protein